MKIGIVGRPFSGKSSVFSAITGLTVTAEAGERTTHISTVPVPDPRLQKLAEYFQPRKITPAVITVVDPLGVEPRREGGAMFSTAEMETLKNCTALLIVIGCFNEEPSAIPATAVVEWDAVRAEFILADQEVVENNLNRLQRVKKKGDPEVDRKVSLLQKCLETLENGACLFDQEFYPEEEQLLAGYAFLSRKPQILALNIPESALDQSAAIETAVREGSGRIDAPLISLSALTEAEIQELPEKERADYLAELGIAQPSVHKVIRACYDMLGLISFLTGGEDEVRAWPIRNGQTAREAARAIHSDIADGFIKAEVTAYQDFIEYGKFSACRDAGVLRLEGRNYIVQDGDVITYRFNKT